MTCSGLIKIILLFLVTAQFEAVIGSRQPRGTRIRVRLLDAEPHGPLKIGILDDDHFLPRSPKKLKTPSFDDIVKNWLHPVTLSLPDELKTISLTDFGHGSDDDVKPVTENIEDDLKYDFRTNTHSI